MNTNYREYKEGDTIRVTGCQGRLFGCGSKRELNDGVKLGVECVLTADEDGCNDVRLPEGILADGMVYLSAVCVELVKPVDETPVQKKPATIEHVEYNSCFIVNNGDDTKWLAKIWYDGGVPKEVAEACANLIKAAHDTAHLA
jgi:hypothetical protein